MSDSVLWDSMMIRSAGGKVATQFDSLHVVTTVETTLNRLQKCSVSFNLMDFFIHRAAGIASTISRNSSIAHSCNSLDLLKHPSSMNSVTLCM